jgi:cytosine deaminase
MPDLLLRGGRPWGLDAQADVLIRDGVIERVGPDLRADPAAEVADVPGRLLLPGLIDAHCHLDKTLFGGRWVPHSAGPALADRIAEERRRRAELGLPDVEHMTALLQRMVASGTTCVRTHTDVVTDHGLAGVEAVWAAQERLGGRVTIEQVAFPQYGVLADPGTAELLDEALRNGVEVIGGIDPAGVDRDPVRHLDIVFALAERHGAGIDIHLHDGGSLGTWQLELIIERAKATGLGGRVAVSHAYGLAQADQATQDRLGRQLADAGVSLVTAAVYNFPVPPIARLRAAGVTIACGHDGIRDLWSPFGSGDMLERAMHLAYRSTFRRDEEIEMALEAATYGGARALGLQAYGLEPGARADIVVVDASTPAEAVVTHPVRDLVIKAGRVVARQGALIG